MEFYSRGEKWNPVCKALEAKRGGDTYLVRDDKAVLEWFYARRGTALDALIKECAANAAFWGEDISKYL